MGRRRGRPSASSGQALRSRFLFRKLPLKSAANVPILVTGERTPVATVLSALIVSNCSRSLFIAERACLAHRMETSCSLASRDARPILSQKGLDFLILDFDLDGANDILALQPKDYQGNPTTVIGLSREAKPLGEGQRKQVPHWLLKPLSGEVMGGVLRGAY